MSSIIIRPSTLDDAIILSRNLRRDDYIESKAAMGGEASPEDFIPRLFDPSWITAVDEAGRVVACGGITPGDPRVAHGTPWLLGTGLFDLRPQAMARVMLRWIRKHRSAYRVLTNSVMLDNESHVKLLPALGFTLLHREAFESGGRTFIPFYWINDSV